MAINEFVFEEGVLMKTTPGIKRHQEMQYPLGIFTGHLSMHPGKRLPNQSKVMRWLRFEGDAAGFIYANVIKKGACSGGGRMVA